MKNKKLFLLDVYPILYRSHFAMLNQHLHTTSGLNTSAILGFCNYIFQIIFKEKPTHIAAAFDSKSLERTGLLPSYKETREKMPEDISVAKKYSETIIDALNIHRLELSGHEADDVIGTIALKAAKEGYQVYIVSPDKDFAQLVSEHILLYRPPYKGLNFEILNAENVKEKFGVPPEQIADFLALKGDPTDNIPGVPKIGDKTANELLAKFGSVENILEKAQEVQKASIRQSLTDNAETARLSKKLATIQTGLPLEFNEAQYLLKAPKTDILVKVLDELEFVRLKERLFANAFYKKVIGHGSMEIQFGNTENPDCSYEEVVGEEALVKLLQEVKQRGKMYFLTSCSGEYINFDFLADGKIHHLHINGSRLPVSLTEVLAAENIEKITYNCKILLKFLFRYGHEIKGRIFDVLLGHYIISPAASHELDKVIAQELGQALNRDYSAKERKCLEVQSLEKLEEKIRTGVSENQNMDLYNKIDLPLSFVLARMELNGIRIDEGALKEITGTFLREMDLVEQRIFDIAGEKFNLRSSKQTADLFSRMMKDRSFKKTKTGQVSTSEAALTELAGDYEIAGQMLRFRRLSKLVSTYTESLPKFVDKNTGRIHAEFLQVSTATGRLSCNNPNLQNLPIRSEEGREIRRAVIPQHDDFLILSADYSQIELRILAALSKDEGLAAAFALQEDIHTVTAARVFNVSEREVTEDMRSKAKMVNYGIAYGISAFGLSQRLKISTSEAKEIITQYFNKFPGIKNYIDGTLEFARNNGYTLTYSGRRRYIDDIRSKNGTERRAAERIAVNAPIQGTSADMIKCSMIAIDNELRRRNLKSRMIIQVHDELVFEVYKPELETLAFLVKEKMEKAIPLSIPIEVNVGVGPNWLDLEEYAVNDK